MPIQTYSGVGTIGLNPDPMPPDPGTGGVLAAMQALNAGAAANYTMPASWDVMGSDDAILDWQVRIHYYSGVLYMVCKRAEDGNSPPLKIMRWDLATDTITQPYSARFTTGGGTGTGHGYDCSAMDDAGLLYYLALYGEQPAKWDGASWAVAAGTVTSGGNETTGPRSLHWHPNLWGAGDGGLVTIRGNNLKAWRKSTGTGGAFVALSAAVAYSSITYAQGAYCSERDEMICTSGTAGRACYRVIPGNPPTVARLPNDTPVICSSNATGTADMSRLMPTPDGSAAIFEQGGTRVWRLDTGTLAWALQADPHSFAATSGSKSWPIAYLPSPYNGYLAIRPASSGRPTVRLQKAWSGF